MQEVLFVFLCNSMHSVHMQSGSAGCCDWDALVEEGRQCRKTRLTSSTDSKASWQIDSRCHQFITSILSGRRFGWSTMGANVDLSGLKLTPFPFRSDFLPDVEPRYPDDRPRYGAQIWFWRIWLFRPYNIGTITQLRPINILGLF